MAHDYLDSSEENQTGLQEFISGGGREFTITPGGYRDERISCGALEDWAIDWTGRLVPDCDIKERQLRLCGTFVGLAWGYAVLLRRLMSALRDIQLAVLSGQATDQESLIDANIKVHAAVLEMGGAVRIESRMADRATIPALARIGHYCLTVNEMYDGLRTLCEEYGVSVSELGAMVLIQVEQ